MALETVGVVGAGAWGTALAQIAALNGHPVRLWARSADVVAAINGSRVNGIYLPSVRLQPGIVAGSEIAELGDCDLLVLACPAQAMRAVSAALAPTVRGAPPLVIAAKGIERDSGLFLAEVLAETVPNGRPAILSGPTFAIEVARDLPTAVTVAAADPETRDAVIACLGRPTFRPYASDDPVGAQIGGAMKNIIAIACGIVAGRRLGENARAALMTRGLAELMRLGGALGAKPQTLVGLSGLGDLALTCNSPTSRNMAFGIALGEGRAQAELLDGRRTVVEGIATAAAVTGLAARRGIDVPIATTVDAIVNQGADIDAGIRALLARPYTDEAG